MIVQVLHSVWLWVHSWTYFTWCLFRCYSLYDYESTLGPTSPDVCSGATLCMTMSSLLDLLHLMFVQVLLSVWLWVHSWTYFTRCLFRCYTLYDYEFTPGPNSPDVCSGATLCMTMSSLLDLLHLMFVQVLLSVWPWVHSWTYFTWCLFRCYSLYDYEFTPGPTSPDVCSGATLCMTMSSLLDLLHLMFVQVLLSVWPWVHSWTYFTWC